MSKRVAIWLTASALGALLPTGAALAADMPVKAKPILAASFDWSGVYVGVHAGYGGGMKDWDNQVDDYVARGPLVGAQVGINKQIGSLVVGAELDGAWANITGAQTVNFGGPLLGVTSTATLGSKIDGIVTLTGRAGLAADRWFVFAKAGIAVLHESHNASQFAVQGPLVIAGTLSADEIRYAPTVGFGSEYALGNNWSVKGEYDYIHVSAGNTAFTGTFTTNGVAVPIVANFRGDQALHLAKVGVNYRWGNVAIDPSFTPVPPAPGTNWTGGYIGVQGGYAWGSKGFPVSAATLFQTNPVNYDMSGWLGGGTIGANVQAGSFVFGVEGEILGTGIRGRGTTVTTGLGITQTDTFDSKIDWLALASARAGFVVGSNLLVYGKGGLAIAQETHNFSSFLNQPGVGTFQANSSAKPVHTGVVVGAGGEYAFAPNWSIKAEYDYVRMFPQGATAGDGVVNVNAPPNNVGALNFFQRFSKINQDLHLIKFGVNYHFNPVQTVVAKY
jgi:outer membrane immunogenic protein